jgi:Zn-dependent protease
MGRVSFDRYVLILYAAMLLLFPLNWILGWVVAAAFHELCHGIAVYFTGGKIRKMHFSTLAILLNTDSMPPGKELISALAGPAGSLLLMVCTISIPEIGLSAAMQGLINLLPVFPLDGGRALRAGLVLRFGEMKGNVIFRYFETVVLSGLPVFGVILSFTTGLGLLPLFLCTLLAVRCLLRKIPCKEAQIAVQ